MSRHLRGQECPLACRRWCLCQCRRLSCPRGECLALPFLASGPELVRFHREIISSKLSPALDARILRRSCIKLAPGSRHSFRWQQILANVCQNRHPRAELSAVVQIHGRRLRRSRHFAERPQAHDRQEVAPTANMGRHRGSGVPSLTLQHVVPTSALRDFSNEGLSRLDRMQ